MAVNKKCVAAAALLAAVLHLTAATSPPVNERFGPSNNADCEEASNPDVWPVKKESQVCGSDGKLYPSLKALKCASRSSFGTDKLQPQERSKCGEDAPDFDPCILSYTAQKKVCGSDNVTYSNIWHMVCEGKTHNVDLTVLNAGECSIECPYSPIYIPVCSNTNFTFANEEALKCRQILQPYSKIDFRHQGECRIQKTNPCHIGLAYKPVCGSNGRTYTSANEVRCLKASNAKLQVLHDGPCTVAEVESIVGLDEVCRMAAHRFEWNPVCGSDNITYNNAYGFLCASKDNKDLKVGHVGECGAFDYCRQPALSDPYPQCGNDGVTYPNENAFYCAQSTKQYLTLKHSGACDKTSDDPCLTKAAQPYSHTGFLDDAGKPVCGSDSVSYVTPEALWCASNTKKDIKLIHSGECF